LYADVPGMPNSSSYWCPWCLLSHSEWNKDPDTFIPEEHTLQFLLEMSEAVQKDFKKQLKPMDRKRVSCERHYQYLGPQNFVLPLLHLDIGMVNQAWESIQEWVDDVLEIVPPIERDARKQVQDAKEKLALALENKKQADATINIELREKSGTATLIKANLCRKYLDGTQREELNVQLTLLDAFITDLKQQMKVMKENLKSCQKNLVDLKKKTCNLQKRKGKTRGKYIS
jgi:hypothetical protein